MVKCKNCKNFFRSFEDVKPFYWCEKIADSPYGEMERECSYYKPKTNAERIRSMTDEELLDFLCSIETYDCGSVKTIEGSIAMCSVTEVEEWLLRKSEV